MSVTSTSKSTSTRIDRGLATRVAVCMAVLGLGMLIVDGGHVPAWERELFRLVNDLPGWLYPVFSVAQQLGALLAVPVFVVICLVWRRLRRAIALSLACMGKFGTEQIVKLLVSRERPATSIGRDIHLRGKVRLTGESFVSGHAILAAALAGVIIPWLPARWRRLAWLPVGLVLFARVYVGAHAPLDVICGAALGVVVATAVNVLWLREHTTREGAPR